MAIEENTDENPCLDLSSKAQLNELMGKDAGCLVIDIWADWCAPCKAMAPQFEAVARAYLDEPVTFCKLDNEHPQVGRSFTTRSIPTILFIHNGQILDVHVGAAPAPLIARKVDDLLSRARGDSFVKRILGLHRKRS